MSSGASQTSTINQRTLSDILTTFLTLTSPTVTNLSQPTICNNYGLSATVASGQNPGTTPLAQLSLSDAIGLLSCFNFQVQTYVNGSITATNSYTITGTPPNPGTALPDNSTFATFVGSLSLADIAALLAQVSFSIKNNGTGQIASWTLSGTPQTTSGDIENPVGPFTALYAFLLLHLLQFSAQKNSGPATSFTIDGNKVTRE